MKSFCTLVALCFLPLFTLGCAQQSPASTATTKPSVLAGLTQVNPDAVTQHYQDLSALYDDAQLFVGIAEPFLPAKDQLVINVAMKVWSNALTQYAIDSAAGNKSVLQADLDAALAGFVGYREAKVATVTPAIAVKVAGATPAPVAVSPPPSK